MVVKILQFDVYTCNLMKGGGAGEAAKYLTYGNY